MAHTGHSPARGERVLALLSTAQTLSAQTPPAALDALSPATQAYVRGLANPKRFRESFLGRALLEMLRRRYVPGARMTETPPHTPLLVTAEGTPAACASIAHTGRSTSTVAVALAGCGGAVAVDCEEMADRENWLDIARHALPEEACRVLIDAAGGAAQPTPPCPREAFYRAWGQKECMIKLNRDGEHYRLAVIDGEIEVVRTESGARLQTETLLTREGGVLVTLVSESVGALTLEEFTLEALLGAL